MNQDHANAWGDLASDDLVWDLETNGLLKVLDRIHVMCIGNVRTGEVVTYTDNDPAYPSLDEGVSRLSSHIQRNKQARRRCTVAHHGIGFDRKALKKVTGVEVPVWAIFDTMVAGRLRDPERLGGHKLESYGVEMGILKGAYDGGWDHYSEDMRAYCQQDGVVTIALYQKLRPVANWGESCDLEHNVFYLVDLQMDNGFKLNVRAGVRLAAEIDAERQGYIAELQRVFPPIYVGAGTKTPKKSVNYKATEKRPAYGVVEGAPFTEVVIQEFNPGSEYHVDRRLFRKYGYRLPTTDKGNPNMTEAILKKLDFPEAALLVQFARAEKRWTQLASPPKKDGKGGGWLHHADEEDRVHGYVNTNGAVTGRMTHSRPNSANIDKDASMRALWIPRDLWKLVGIDAEGLELRVLAHYLARYDGGELTRQLLEGDKAKGTDAHSINRKNTDLFSRDGAKTLLYGSLYGAGDEKAGNIWIADWRTSGKPIEEWPAWAIEWNKAGTRCRLKSPTAIGKVVKARLINGIKGFKELKDAIAAKAKSQGWVRGIDGRRIRIRHAHAALNTLLQGTGAIVMKCALVLLYEDLTERGLVHGVDYGFCANVHDEWQIECKPELAELIGKAGMAAITRAGEHFNFRCRLDGAFDIGTNWHETH